MSLPYDINSDKQYFNLSNKVVRPARAAAVAGEEEESAEFNDAEIEEERKGAPRSTKIGHSPLERLYEATDGTGKFDRVVGFLGTMAEAESFRGKKTYNDSSSAAGVFHFLVDNGGGYDKDGKKTQYGQYDAKGVLRTSSFETAKTRLRAMMQSPSYSDTIAKQPGLMKELNNVLTAVNPNQLSPQRQALLAYANLKMQSGDFDMFLAGKQEAADVYGKVWVTSGGTHSTPEIRKNWQNAIARSGKDPDINYTFFGLAPRSAFGGRPASPILGESTIPYVHDYSAFAAGGKLEDAMHRIEDKKRLI